MVSVRSIVLASFGGLGVCASSFGAINPFTETFSSSAASWSSGSTFTALNYPSSGGPDGSGYGSTPFTFSAGSNGVPTAIFRCQTEFSSSGGAFFGSYVAAGVSTLTYSVRHDAPFPLEFFGRFVATGSPVGVAYTSTTLVAPNTWTTLTIPINNFADPNWTPEGGPSLFGSTFADVARVQIGVWGDANTASQNGPWTFDIDNVSLTPAPGATALLGLAGLAMGRRRR
ncbi:MAG TPA: hypothetical protein VHC70_11955 [Phycisphaerales bacterium]|nr:hypothetical protein [Phycisphaerales bacterium]